MQFPPILIVLKIKYIFLCLDILNIGCTTDFEMYPFILFHLQALTQGYIREPCSPSPCSESINFYWFQKILWCVAKYLMTCHGTFCTSLEICHMEKWIYQEYSMTWHGIFLKILFCSSEPAHLLTCSLISVVYI
jgi:hypothetical protein